LFAGLFAAVLAAGAFAAGLFALLVVVLFDEVLLVVVVFVVVVLPAVVFVVVLVVVVFVFDAILFVLGAVFVSPPQAIPKALKAKSVESAITFFILKVFLLSSSKIKLRVYLYRDRSLKKRPCPNPLFLEHWTI